MADLRNAFEAWAEADNRDLAPLQDEEWTEENNHYYVTDSSNEAFIGWKAGVKAERERCKWQPIETAPKDGVCIDVWVDGEFAGRRTDVSWRKPTDGEWWTHGGDTIETPDATWHDCFGPLGKSEPPTHWMPKPAAPTTGGDNG